MRICILATHPIQYHAPLFRELAARDGVDLTVYFAHKPTPEEQGRGFGVAFEWDVDLTSGYRHVFLENRAKHPAAGFFGYDTPEIGEIIRDGRFDVVILHGWARKCMWQAMFACWRHGVPFAQRSDSQLPQGSSDLAGGIKQLIKRLIYPLFIRRISFCLPYGSRSAEYFRFFGGRNITVSPHFVANELCEIDSSNRRSTRTLWRDQWRIPANSFCFLFCGKFESKKRPADFLQAMERISTDSNGSIYGLMVGDGPLRRELESGDCSRVTFTGFLNQSEMKNAYLAADCLVLPSTDLETWGLVVNEAMAAGMPVIVSDACGCAPDLIEEGVTGFTFPSGDILQLAARMKELLTSGNAEAMGAAARAEINRDHTARVAVDQILEALHRA